LNYLPSPMIPRAPLDASFCLRRSTSSSALLFPPTLLVGDDGPPLDPSLL